MRTAFTLTCLSTCTKCSGEGLVFTDSSCGSSERLPRLCRCVRSAETELPQLELDAAESEGTVTTVGCSGFRLATCLDVREGDSILHPTHGGVVRVGYCHGHMGRYYLMEERRGLILADGLPSDPIWICSEQHSTNRNQRQ